MYKKIVSCFILVIPIVVPVFSVMADTNTTLIEERKIIRSFTSFRSEANTAKKEIECPNSVASDMVPAMWGDGALYGCILGKNETVKWFINENTPNSNQVKNVKFLWNDWFKDRGHGRHPDKKEAKKTLKALIKLYAPKKSKEVYSVFFGNTSKTIIAANFILNYTYIRGPAIDERMIIVTKK